MGKEYIKVDPKEITRIGEDEIKRAMKKKYGTVKPIKGAKGYQHPEKN
jgi:hypothetical protein